MKLSAGAAFAGLLLTASSAVTAQADQSRSDLKELDKSEIVVTATRRPEKVINVPSSISALGGRDLQKMQARNLSSYLSQVPGVVPIDYGGEGTNVVMRGISTAVDGEANGTGSAIYLGEALVGGNLSRAAGSPNFRPIDIDRVEVLRGPQGTLYGAGSLSGTVRIVPAAPNLKRFEGGGGASVSDKADGGGLGWAADAHVNVPLADEVAALRLVGYKERESGFVHNIRLDQRIGDSKVTGGRAAVKVVPAAGADVTATISYQRRSADGLQDFNPLLPHYETDRVREIQDRRSLVADVVANGDLGSGTLTSVSTLFRDKINEDDIDYDRIDAARPLIKRLSQEVRFASRPDRPLRWLVGAYAERVTTGGTEVFLDPETRRLLPRDGGGLGYKLAVNQTQYAAFGEASLDFARHMTATVGARYARYSIRDNDISIIVDPDSDPQFVDKLPLDSPDNRPIHLRLKDKAFTPKLNLAYKPDDRHTYYVQAARGFRVGGVREFLTDNCALAGAGGPFKSDSIWSFEGGGKVASPDRNFAVSAAAFYSVWKNIPVYLGDLSCFEFYTANAAKARSYGLETEMSAHPARGLNLTASLAYTNARLTDITGAAGAGRVGEPLVGAPKWTADLGIDYERPVGAELTMFAGANANYVGRYSNGLSCDFNGFAGYAPAIPSVRFVPGTGGCYDSYAFDPPQFAIDPGSGDYVTVNVQLGLRRRGSEIYLFSRNLLDNKTRTYLEYFAQDGFLNYTRVTPRVIGLAVRTSF